MFILITCIIIMVLVILAITPEKCRYYNENGMECENHHDCEHCAYYIWRERGRD